MLKVAAHPSCRVCKSGLVQAVPAQRRERQNPRTAVQDELPLGLPAYRRERQRRQAAPQRAAIGDLVLDFHRAFDLPRNAGPTLDVAPQIAALRLRLLAEEVGELREAVNAADLIAIADALADITYVVFGTAVTYGIDLEAVVREVHRSNMSKLDASGLPILRQDGKVLKSEAFVRPDINTVLALQRSLF
ncbi:MazG nucleotide pyrophosphohydrolase domain-containing protein [Isoptericola sp. NPDC057559]|uniref:MazG nucleotide pyrophosphohydrolase domain-containing protein n=1 Tax=Isoptericola sp. NPDC057559 TaxID=3346168 RepID=UPI0036CC1E5D